MVAATLPPQQLDVEDLLTTIGDPRAGAVLALMGCQGLAPAEVYALDVEDVSLTSNRLFVHGRYGRVRCLTLAMTTRSHLERYLAVRPAVPEPALLLSRDRQRLSARQIRDCAARAGVRGFDLRHAFTRDALANGGMDPRALRDQLGLLTIAPVFESAEHHVVWEGRVRRKRWKSAPLRRWVLEVLEEQLEAWHLRDLKLVPPTFRWPPLPPEDLAKLQAAAPSIAKVIDVILGDLLVKRPARVADDHLVEARKLCLMPGTAALARR